MIFERPATLAGNRAKPSRPQGWPRRPGSRKDAVRTFGRPAGVDRFEACTIMVWRKNLLPDLGPAVN
jgi:hypothetical protein